MQDILVSNTSTLLSQTQDTKLTFKVARNGDLLGKCWFEVFLPNTTGGNRFYIYKLEKQYRSWIN